MQLISIVLMKFVPCSRTEFPEYCSGLFYFSLGGTGCLQDFLCRELGPFESFLWHQILLLSSFYAIIMVRTSSALLNESSQHATVRVMHMQ